MLQNFSFTSLKIRKFRHENYKATGLMGMQYKNIQKELDAYLRKFAELEKEKERILAQYKKYLEAVKRRKSSQQPYA